MQVINSPTNGNSQQGAFLVTIGFAYYNQGFFNVRVKYSELFGADKESISIQLGENKNDILIGHINRTANTNRTPRIMAGWKYTSWIRQNFKIGDNFKVQVINSKSIILSKP